MRRAFTLVETLVATVIVTVLAGLSLTVLGIGKEAAQGATCLSNVKALGEAVHLYAADYDDRMPFAADRWLQDAVLHNGYEPPMRDLIAVATPFDRAVAPYGTSGVLACPFDLAHPRAKRGNEPAVSFFAANGTSYTYNERDGLRSTALSEFAVPARAPLLTDYDCYHRPDEDPHRARVNLVASDGNARSVTCFERVMRELNRDY